MRRRPRILVFALLSGALSTMTAAENVSAPGPASDEERARNPLLAPDASRQPPPAKPRLMSDEIAARLAASVPKYTPPPAPSPAPANPPPPEDRPKNTIIRLPRYIVEGERPPKIKERQMLTQKAKLDLAYKTFPGLRLGSLPFFSNDAVAMEMWEEQQALERRREMAELFTLAATGDKEKDKQLKEQTEEALSKTKTWTDTGGSYQQQKR